MHHDHATRMINEQIAREIRTLNSILTDEADKPAIIQRIADLKAMIDSDSSVKETAPQTTRELVSELISAFRR